MTSLITLRGTFIAMSLLIANVATHAQAGALDPSFDPIDPAWGDGSGFNAEVMAQALQPDGRVIASGDFTTYNGAPAGRIIRLRPDGIVDPTFDPGLGFNGGGYVQALALQADGKVIVGGAFDEFNGAPCDNIVRLNADGSLDPTFVTPIGSGASVLALAVQPDGRILVGGNIPGLFTRLNSDGSPDATFDTGGAFSGYIAAIALQPDGRIIVGGAFGAYNGTGPNQIVRLNADGSHDPSFAPAFGFDSFVNCLALLPDGDVYAGGDFLTFDGVSRPHLARLNSDGTLDAAFEVDPAIPDGASVYALAVVPNGSQYWVAVGGSFDYSFMQRLMVCHPNGDTDYQFWGMGIDGQFVESIVRQPDGSLLVGGWFEHCLGEARGNHVRVTGYGQMDHYFNYAIGLQQTVYDGYTGKVEAMVLQADGKVIAGGHFDAYNGVAAPHLIRLNADGTRDFSFTPPALGVVRSLLFQPDGRLLVGGDWTMRRLMPDGTADPSFYLGSGPDGPVHCIALQPNGRMLVGGDFGAYNGFEKPGIVRLMPNGVVDGSFDVSQLDPDSVRMQHVNAIAIQPDGRIIIGGRFWQLGGTIAGNIQRLNANGSVNYAFNTGWGLDSGYPDSGEVEGLILYPDGRVLAYGGFSYYDNDHMVMDGIPRNGIALLNTDGSLDMTFNPQGVDGALWSMIRIPGGGFMIGGDFTEVDGTPREDLARLLPDGGLDASFDPGTGVQGWYGSNNIQAIALQPDGNLMIAGEFKSYDDVYRGNIARVLGASAGCSVSQLTTTADPVISCGAVGLMFDGSSTIATTEVAGANKYQFRFTNVAGEPSYARNIAFPTRMFTLYQWTTNPLKAGRTYNVIVRASFDNGVTWCSYGPSCTVKVSGNPLPATAQLRSMQEEGTGQVLFYPNPNDGGTLHLLVDGIDPAVDQVTFELFDLSGRVVMTRMLPVGDGAVDILLPLDADLTEGLYVVKATAGDLTTTDRLVIQH